MNRHREKTIWAIEEYINILIETLNIDTKFQDDHFRGIELLSCEKNKHFQNAQRIKEFNNKRKIPVTKLNNIWQSMSSKEIANYKDFKSYADSISQILDKEKLEIQQNENAFECLKQYIEKFMEVKKSSREAYSKLVNSIKSKLSNYAPELPMIEFWEFMVEKYESQTTNSKNYHIFIADVKSNMETLISGYKKSMKNLFKEINQVKSEIVSSIENLNQPQQKTHNTRDDIKEEAEKLSK